MKSLQIGIFGLGTVGSGVVEILKTNTEIIKMETGLTTTVKKICVKNLNKTRQVDVDSGLLTTDKYEILDDDDIDIVVEVMGSIEEAKCIIEEAFKRRKHVVSANKDLIAVYGRELTELAQKYNCHFFYEAAVAGGIPILKALQFSLRGNKIKKIGGIVNGSTNYILTRMEVEKLSLERIIEDALALGYLEADPSADLDGLDAGRKCAILASMGFHSLVRFNQVFISGIRNISLEDIEYAKELGYKIKLLAIAEDSENGVIARVHPALIPVSHPLSSVMYEFNAVYVIGDMVGETMFYGRGAGALPTGSAVVSDIIETGGRMVSGAEPEYGYDFFNEKDVLSINDLGFSYYVKLKSYEKEGRALEIRNILEDEGISIKYINRYEQYHDEKKLNEYVIVTNDIKESVFNSAIERVIEEIENMDENPTVIRIEKGL